MREAGEFGPPPSSDGCRKCSERPGRGVTWVEEGVVYWKCDDCSHTQHEGVLEEVNRAQIEKLSVMDNTKDNQMRFVKERWARMDEVRLSAKERPGEDIVKEMWDDSGIFYHDAEKESNSAEITRKIYDLQPT